MTVRRFSLVAALTTVALALVVPRPATAAAVEPWRLAREAIWAPFADDPFTLALFHFDERAPAKKEINLDNMLEDKRPDALDATTEPAEAPATGTLRSAQNAARQASLAQRPAQLDGDCELVPDGRFGGSLRFAGGDGRLLVKGLRQMAAHTLEFHLKLDALPTGNAVLAYCFATPEAKTEAQPVRLQLTPDGAPQVVWRGQALPAASYRCRPGTWVHLALVWSSQWPYTDEILLFADGKRIFRQPMPGQVALEGALDAILIGNTPNGKTGFKGCIDELRVSGTVRQYYESDLDWLQPARKVAWQLDPPFMRDAADLLFRAGFDKTLKPEQAASGTQAPDYTITQADEELTAAKVRAQFPAGVDGTGLALGDGGLNPVYKGTGNLDPTRGTIAFWLLPVNWDNLTRSSRFGGPPPLGFGLFQIDGEYAEGSYKRNFTRAGPLLEFNVEMRMDEGVENPVDLTPGKWVHITMTWEGMNVTYYVNGQRRDPGGAWSIWLPVYPNEDPGRNAAKPEWWLNAKPEAIRFGNRTYWEQLKIPAPKSVLDDFRVYRRPLAPKEIANLVRLYDPRTKPEPLPPAEMEMTWNGVSGRVALSVIPLLAKYRDAASIAARVVKAGAAKPVGEARVTLDDRRQAVVEVRTPPLEFATYTAQADILDAAGATLATLREEFTRTPPPWWGCKAGVSDKVMPEWTPLKVSGSTVSLWGREISFSALGLPEKIVSAGQPVLAAPVSVAARIDGKDARFEGAAGALRAESATEVLVKLRGAGQAGPVAWAAETAIEFDGMMWFDVTLTPAAGASPSLDALTLALTYTADSAQTLHWWSGERNMRDPKMVHIADLPVAEGVLFRSNDAATVTLPKEQRGSFIPYVMLTGMARGMAWFAENDRGWTQSTTVPAVTVERRGNTVLLTLNLVTTPVKLDGPRSFAFGLQPIPVKPLPAEWRRSPSYSNVFPDTFCGNNLKGRRGATSFYVYPEDDWEEVKRRANGEGLTKGAAGLKGLYAGQMERLAKAGRTKPVPLEITVPGLYWDLQWNGIPPLAHTREWAETWALNYQSYTPAFVEFCSWAWNDWISKTDKFVRGAYMDDCWGCPQTTENSPVTYRLADGHIQPGYQFRGWRERGKRMRQISWDNGVDPHITAHSTHTFYIPFHSCFDLILDGEDFYSTPNDQTDFIDHWPLDRMRFMHNGKWGLITTWLGWCGNSLKTDKWPAWTYRQTRAYTASLALHDIMWNFDEKTLQAFGLHEPDTVFIPYWADGGLAKHAHPGLRVSAWKRAGKCLVLLVNVGKDRLEADVALDPKIMGVADSAAGVKVRDADPALLTYFDDDVTTIAKPAADQGNAEQKLDDWKKDQKLDTADLDEKPSEQAPDKRRAQDPDGTFSWADGRLKCPVRRHDFRLFEVSR